MFIDQLYTEQWYTSTQQRKDTETVYPYPYEQYANEVKQTLDQLPWERLHRMVEMLETARLERRQVFIMGNGGSAATASHMACDLGKNTALPGYTRLRVMSLNDNMALFSACANDCEYENVFAEQLKNFVGEKDIVVAISASGNSQNVLNAIDVAQSYGAYTVGWSGYHGGKLSQVVDMSIVTPNHCIEQIEDIHLMMVHMVTVSLRQTIRENTHLLFSESQPILQGNESDVAIPVMNALSNP